MYAPDLIREINWRIRHTLTASMPVIKHTTNQEIIESNIPKHAHHRYIELTSLYSTSSWERVCTLPEIFENLYVLDICDRHVGSINTETSLDIGSKNWCYLPALTAFTTTAWHGVELDAFRRYWNFSTRKAYADYMMCDCDVCRYYPTSLFDIKGQYSLITWFLPFVKPEPLRYWGLPDRFFAPEQLFNHAWQLLASGGTLFVVNQGQEEADIQKKLFDNEHIDARYLGEITSPFSPYKLPRFGWLATKSQ